MQIPVQKATAFSNVREEFKRHNKNGYDGRDKGYSQRLAKDIAQILLMQMVNQKLFWLFNSYNSISTSSLSYEIGRAHV